MVQSAEEKHNSEENKKMAKSGRSGLKKNLFAVCAVVAYALIGSASGAWADEEGAELAWKYNHISVWW